MAIGTPITITVNAVAIVMNKIKFDNMSSLYSFSNATKRYQLWIRHGYTKPNKDGVVYVNHNVEFSITTFAVPGVSFETVDKTFITSQRLEALTDVDLAHGLLTMCLASSDQFLKDLLQLQS